jgi:hypothetical protein
MMFRILHEAVPVREWNGKDKFAISKALGSNYIMVIGEDENGVRKGRMWPREDVLLVDRWWKE